MPTYLLNPRMKGLISASCVPYVVDPIRLTARMSICPDAPLPAQMCRLLLDLLVDEVYVKLLDWHVAAGYSVLDFMVLRVRTEKYAPVAACRRARSN